MKSLRGWKKMWPPDLKDSKMVDCSHSAPGALLTVADVLIGRAQLLIDRVRSTEDAVHGAVLSVDGGLVA